MKKTVLSDGRSGAALNVMIDIYNLGGGINAFVATPGSDAYLTS